MTGAAQRLASCRVGRISENFEIFQGGELYLVAKKNKGSLFGVFTNVSFQENTNHLCLFLFEMGKKPQQQTVKWASGDFQINK